MLSAGEFDSIPVGSPTIGFDASDPRFNYVDSFPVTALENGLDLALKLLGGPPDLVVSGPNVGSNLGLITQFSGTMCVQFRDLSWLEAPTFFFP
jgi:5'-nucleotidase